MVLLTKAYGGYAAATIVQLQTVTEAALIAQGLATMSAGPVTNGTQAATVYTTTTNMEMGRAAGAAAATVITVANASFTAESRFMAALSNAAADATATFITRIIPAVGSVQFVLNAAATGAVSVDWVRIMVSGETQTAG